MPMPSIVCLLALLGACAAASQPHIIMHLADDLGHFNLGFMGNKEARTPHIDELVANGVKLDRFYTYKYCSPTRSSFLSGRLPIRVNTENRAANAAGGVDMRMTTIAKKLQGVGYSTYHAGKWHAGAYATGQLPINVGFNASLGYLGGAEGHYNQREGNDGALSSPVDLFKNGAPAYGMNGTYGAYMYSEFIVDVINNHDVDTPLFVYHAWQEAHVPNEVPVEFTDPSIDYPLRRTYEGMVHALDSGIENVTNALKAKGMYNNTLIVFSSDNGGRQDGEFGGNNYPLRGQKFTDFEGGVRVAAFASGGALPTAVRGSTHSTGLMHIADLYTTMCAVAGCDPTDNAADVPPPESFNLWPALSTGSASPRDSLALSDSAYINWPYKLVEGTQKQFGFWTAPVQPNATQTHWKPHDKGCPAGCVFDLSKDPTEHVDLSGTLDHTKAALRTGLAQEMKSAFQTGDDCCAGYTQCVSNQAYIDAHQGFLGPLCSKPDEQQSR